MTAIKSTSHSSAKYGPCICGEHASGHRECLEGPADDVERKARAFDTNHHGRAS